MTASRPILVISTSPAPAKRILPEVPLQKAMQELRRYLRESQPGMAVALGISVAAIRTYERGLIKAPEARAVIAYLVLADRAERQDLAEIFGAALQTVLGVRSDVLIEQLRKIRPIDL